MSKATRLRPARAARAFCMECMNGQHALINDCPSRHCPMYPHRMGKGRVTLKTMRTYCLHCQGWELVDGKLDPDYKRKGEAVKEAKNCTDRSCPLHPYRPGTKPYRGIKKGSFKPTQLAFSTPETAGNHRPYG